MDAANDWVEVYRSPTASACDERAFVLLALGIPTVMLRDADLFSLRVSPADATRSALELAGYAIENRPLPAPPPPRLHGGALASTAAFACVLFLCAIASSRSLGGLDWYARGILDGELMRAGDWWRPVTALTLHADLAHLAANVGFGALFGGLAARVYGAGAAWLLILVAATLANVANGVWMPAGRESLGASTAVFAALGALAVHRWPAATARRRAGIRGASVVAALVLLALLGTGDAHTDILAHALGFASGALLALPLGRRPVTSRRRQLAAGAFALLGVAVAWALALTQSG